MNTTKLVVFIILVIRFTDKGISLLIIWGIITYKYICFLFKANAVALSIWLLGMLSIAPLTKSPISAVPQIVNTIIALVSAEIWIPYILVSPKYAINNNTRGGIILIICKYICEIILVTGFLICIKSPNNIPKIIEKNAETKLNFIVTHKPYRSLSKFVPFDNKSITVSNIF